MRRSVECVSIDPQYTRQRPHQDDSQAPAVALGLDKRRPRHSLCLALNLDRLLDLLQLVDNKLVALVPVGMVLGEHVVCLLDAAVGHEPARRLWNERNGGQGDDRHNDLEQEAHAPAPVRVAHVHCPEAHPRGDNAADVEACLDERGRLGTVTRVRNLGRVRAARDAREAAAKAEDEAPAKHLPPARGERLHERADNDDNVPDHQGPPAAKLVCRPRSRDVAWNRAERLSGNDRAELGWARVVDRLHEERVGLQPGHDGAVVA